MKKIQYPLLKSLLILFIISISIYSFSVNAKELFSHISLTKMAIVPQETEQVSESGFKEYTVRPGDHIWAIVSRYGKVDPRRFPELLQLIKEKNPMLQDPSMLQPGDTILIPSNLKQYTLPEISEISNVSSDFTKYQVLPGDTVSEVIVKVNKLKDMNRLSSLIDKFKILNPHIKNVDLIYPGQVLRIPTLPGIVEVQNKHRKEEKKVVKATTPPEKILPNIKNFIKDFVPVLGGRVIMEGYQYIPLPGEGEVSLKGAMFPLIEFPPDTKVVIDLHSQLPERIRGLIQENWASYHIINPPSDGNLVSLLDALLPFSGYQPRTSPLIIGDVKNRIKMRVEARYLFENEKRRENRFIGVAFEDLKEPKESFSNFIKAYLIKHGIRIVRIDEKNGKKIGEEEGDFKIEADSSEASLPSNIIELTTGFLNLIDHGYEKGGKIQLTSTKPGSVDVAFYSDILTTIQGKRVGLHFKPISSQMKELLKDQGIRVYIFNPKEPPQEVVSKLCTIFGLKQSIEKADITLLPSDTIKIVLSLKGKFYRDQAGTEYFIGEGPIAPEIKAFLLEKGYLIFLYSPKFEK